MDQPIISVSGLRGIIGQSLDPAIAIRYASAFCQELGPGAVLVARDGRTTGPMLVSALASAITALGRDCLLIDVAATPTVGIAVRERNAAGGIQVSASHNPPEYNGLKLFGPEGRVVPEAFGQRVLDRYHADKTEWSAFDKVGRIDTWDDPHAPHLEKILAVVDVDSIRKKQFRVVLDSNHGSGSLLGERLLAALGCNYLVLGEEPDGRFTHPPEPIAENLALVGQTIRDFKADIGFCQDPDADRLAIFDETARFIGEEVTLALAVEHVLSQTPGPVVTNCSTSRMSQTLAERHGVAFAHSRVGEAHVVDAMHKAGSVIGGEGNGGVIDLRIGPVRDSFIGMALVLEMMATRGKPLSEIVAALPRYEIVKQKQPLDRSALDEALTRLANAFPEAQVNRQDGVRLDWDNGWVLVRPSNTEPIVRIMGEAETLAEAQELCRRAAEQLAG
jgi:phosphomannomutase